MREFALPAEMLSAAAKRAGQIHRIAAQGQSESRTIAWRDLPIDRHVVAVEERAEHRLDRVAAGLAFTYSLKGMFGCECTK